MQPDIPKCFVFLPVFVNKYAFARLFIDALWSPAGKGLSLLSFVMPKCEVITFPLVSWVLCLIVSIPDICPLSYLYRGRQ